MPLPYELDAILLRYHGLDGEEPDTQSISGPNLNPIAKVQESIRREKIDIATPLKVAQDPDALDWIEEPVDFRTFCESKEHMSLLPKGWKPGDEGALSERQYKDALLMLGEDPKDMFNPETRKYTFGALLWGKGSGKDFICSLIQAYICYILLCMRSPQDYFGFASGESCDILNIGKKGQQGERVYFTKFRARILNWKWLKDRYNIEDQGKIAHKAGADKPLCKIGTKSCEWTDKSIRAFSETPKPEGYEGYNIIFYLCDEISGWVSEAERIIADKVMYVLRTSQTSRNTKSLMGLGMAISYPRQDESSDIMFEFKRESQEPGSKVFWSEGYPWEIRPQRLYSGKKFQFNVGTEDTPDYIDVPVELEEDFNRKPEESKGAYLLRPPAVHGQYFEYEDKLDDILNPARQNLFKVETSYIESKDGTGNKITYVRKSVVGLLRQPDSNVDYVAWLDAADTNCDAALTIGHSENVTLVDEQQTTTTSIFVVDQVIVWEPDEKLRRIVDIGSMTTCCLTAMRYITLAAVWWDQWNSGTGMFDLRNANILCDKHNLMGPDWEFFKTCAYTSRIQAPDTPDCRKAVAQIKHLRRTRTGNVEPGSKKHKKDIADTWCGCVALVIGSLIQKTFRRGRAPAPINIMGGMNMPRGTPASGYSQNAMSMGTSNPFSSPMHKAGASLIRDHSGLFGSGVRTRVSGGGSSKPKPHAPGAGPRMPRGRTV